MSPTVRAILFTCAACTLPAPAFAETLAAPPDAPLWMHIGAGVLLWSHIVGGTLGILSGAVAVLTRKGGPTHRAAGKVFLVSMLVMAAIGAGVSPFLNDRINIMAGTMTLYMVATGFAAARQRNGVTAFDLGSCFFAIAGAGAIGVMLWMARQTPEGTLDGAPPQALYIFLTVTVIAALGDIKLVLRRGLTGAQRIARHVWRMCFGFFVATGSLFLGQMQVFPEWLQDTPALFVAALAPLPFLFFWVVRVRFDRRFAGPPPSVAASARASH